MKTTKKLTAILLALCMLILPGIAVFALEGEADAKNDGNNFSLSSEKENPPSNPTPRTNDGKDNPAAADGQLKLSFKEPDPATGEIKVAGHVNYSRDFEGVFTYIFNKGTEYTLTFIPKKGCIISEFTLNGEKITLDDSLTYKAVIEDNINLEAIFTPSSSFSATIEFQKPDELKDVEIKAFCNGEEILGSFLISQSMPAEITFELSANCAVSTVLFRREDGDITKLKRSGNKFILSKVTGNGVFTAVVSPAYTVTVSSASGGKVSTPGGSYAIGEQVYIEFIPDEGYEVSYLLIDGEKILPDGNSYVFTVTGTSIITVYFKEKVKYIDIPIFNDDSRGSLSGDGITYADGKISVEEGVVATVMIKPALGFAVDKVLINNEEAVLEGFSFSFEPKPDTVIEIVYKKAFRITAVVSDAGGGKILTDENHPLTDSFVYVSGGEDVVFTFLPDMGYKIDYVKIDGKVVKLSEDNTYTFKSVSKNHTVSAVFTHEHSQQMYTIYATAGAHGSISPSGTKEILQGESITFEIIPDEGYEIDYVQVNGSYVSLKDGKYEFKDVASNFSINAYFKKSGQVPDGVISKEDIDWTQNPIIISLKKSTVIDKSVFDFILSDKQSSEIIIKSDEFEYHFPANSVFTLSGTSADMKIIRNGGSNYDRIISLLDSQGIKGDRTVLSCPQTLTFPQNTEITAFIGATLAKKTVQLYIYKDEKLTPASEVFNVDATGRVVIKNYSGGDLVFVRSDIDSFTVAVINGGHGQVVPGMNGRPVTDKNIIAHKGDNISFTVKADVGFVIGSVKIDGIDAEIEKGKAELIYTLNVKDNHNVEFIFVPEEQESSSNSGLIISIVVLALALIGGGVLFFLKWKQSSY